MRRPFWIAVGLLAAGVVSAPAYGWSGAQIPEPSNLMLFGLGLAGLLIGRAIARRPRDVDKDED